ncbi:hypothetical protein RvY_19234 [Ramazzottius varieornatus]|uniref:G-protein coupled receptors family 1 profile domain-containing protein n=1 Tax=Ramazzottius varieornatus TaxID=947166 RepID=A0A1D1W8S3_RAMVA|nr:hypothetical protein RvY_19234 [Ramazzottius varieornatus]
MLMIMACWAIGIGFNVVPHAVTHGGFFGPVRPFGECGIVARMPVFPTVQIGVGIFVPVLGAAVIYVVLFLFLAVKNARARRKQTAPLRKALAVANVAVNSQKRPAMRRRITQAQRRAILSRVLFVSALWHAICFLPVRVWVVAAPGAFFTNLPLQLWLRVLTLLGYSFNPVLFLALNHDYREGAMQLLTGRCKYRLPFEVSGSKVTAGIT